MKAEENLMVGDWVKFKGSDLYHQVKVVSNKSIKFDNQKWFAKSSVESILLTPEILEKNEFVFVSANELNELEQSLANLLVANGKYVYEKRSDCGFLVERADIYYSEKNKAWSLEHSFGKKADINTANIDYIHELQHAMRLCGIEKEIVL
ncbi:MAG: hypothetical protein II692_02990 [Paludibacteraceae bacterium]|nr:hypothetical protein [Paludibacteraceae bacterium]